MVSFRSRIVSALRTRRGRVLTTHHPDVRLDQGYDVTGVVEQFSREQVAGWVAVEPDAPPTKVSLHLGGLKVASTFATSDVPMSDGSEFRRHGITTEEGLPKPVLPWHRLDLAGPAGDRRNSLGQVRTFSFQIRGIWSYVKKTTKITVRVNGQPLPIYGHGTYLNPPRDGKRSVRQLREKLSNGYVLRQDGRVGLSKQLDLEWQQSVMKLYKTTRELVRNRWGYDTFLMYGTLLGSVREGNYIGHDADFDAGYISHHRTGREAAQELADIALTLIDAGLEVDCRARLLHIHDREHPSTRIDLFHMYFDGAGKLCFPWGIAGTSTFTRSDWAGIREVVFSGDKALIPENAERLVEHLYGSDWRRPKPGFSWSLARTDVAEDGVLSIEERTKVYWANFYAHTQYTSGSTFFDYVNGRDDTPRRILDIGCGDGRDACAFGAAGRTVLGVDQASVGLEHAAQHARNLGVADRVRFQVADVAVEHDLRRLIEGYLDESDEPTMFYLRFFLHAIPEDVQETVLQVIADCARPGDTFAAEFRTDRDESRRHVHAKHFRRFQSAGEFRDALVDKYGFEVLYDVEGTGLSPYQDEDPVLYRVLARR